MNGYLVWAIVATIVVLLQLLVLMNMFLTVGAFVAYNADKGLPLPTDEEREALKLWIAKKYFGLDSDFPHLS